MESTGAKATSPYERHTMEEFARLGDDAYDRVVRPTLRPEDEGRIVAIDIESGDFEIGDDEVTVADRLVERRPDAGVWLVRVGRRYVHRFGGRGHVVR